MTLEEYCEGDLKIVEMFERIRTMKWWIIGCDQAGPYVVGCALSKEDADKWKRKDYEIIYKKDKPNV